MQEVAEEIEIAMSAPGKPKARGAFKKANRVPGTIHKLTIQFQDECHQKPSQRSIPESCARCATGFWQALEAIRSARSATQR